MGLKCPSSATESRSNQMAKGDGTTTKTDLQLDEHLSPIGESTPSSPFMAFDCASFYTFMPNMLLQYLAYSDVDWEENISPYDTESSKYPEPPRFGSDCDVGLVSTQNLPQIYNPKSETKYSSLHGADLHNFDDGGSTFSSCSSSSSPPHSIRDDDMQNHASSIASICSAKTICEFQNCRDDNKCRAHISDFHTKCFLNSFPAKCPWRSCTSKVVFLSAKQLQIHTNNIHSKPLICKQPGCHYKKPFSKKTDLKRHIMTFHKQPSKLICRVSGCDATFYRQDKFKAHQTTMHGDYVCRMAHCPRGIGNGFASRERLSKHLKEHGEWECGLDFCGLSRESKFLPDQLVKHLEEQHKMDILDDDLAMVKIDGDKGYKVTRDTFLNASRVISKCTSCNIENTRHG